MDKILEYILSVIGVALIVSLANTFIDIKSPLGAMLKLITGLVLTSVIISPWSQVQIEDLYGIFQNTDMDASCIVQDGEHMANTKIIEHIKEKTEAYILDRAMPMGLDIDVEVSFDELAPYTPHCVRITGNVSPYAKQRLAEIISKELNIEKEHQIWS